MSTAFERYRPRSRARGLSRLLRTFASVLLASLLWYALASIAVVTTFRVGSDSMSPALQPGDRVLASLLSYGGRLPWSSALRLPGVAAPKRGDLVVVVPPYVDEGSLWARLFDPVVRFFTANRRALPTADEAAVRLVVKRIVAIPGDTVRMVRSELFVRISGGTEFQKDGELLPGIALSLASPLPAGWGDELPFSGTVDDLRIESGHYFVVGDNRATSADSRVWGPVPAAALHSRVVLRFWPFSRFGRP